MAATDRCRSPRRHRGPIPARADRKVELPHPGWLRRHFPHAVGGRCGPATRRPPRRSPMVAHPRPATANAKPGTHSPEGDPGDQPHDHDLTRAASRAALGADAGVRPGPLTRPPDAERRPACSGSCAPERHRLVKADSTLLSATGSLCPQLDPPAVTGKRQALFWEGSTVGTGFASRSSGSPQPLSCRGCLAGPIDW